jgi:hypothetical protein
LASDKEGVTRVFYAAHAKTVQAFQEIAQSMRIIPEIRRTFTLNAQRAITVRGTAPQVAMAEWLFNDLDQPNLGSPVASLNADAIHEFRSPASDDVVRVFYLINTSDVPAFQRFAQEVRVKAGSCACSLTTTVVRWSYAATAPRSRPRSESSRPTDLALFDPGYTRRTGAFAPFRGWPVPLQLFCITVSSKRSARAAWELCIEPSIRVSTAKWRSS